MTKKQRVEYLIDYFKERQPEISTELEYGSVFQLLCAVMLSAQCTDKRVNMVTPALFKAFPTPDKLAEAEPEDVLEYVSSVSYPNAKSLHLVQMARKLMSDFNGEVPHTLDEMTSLPGVGRKTANVMLAVAFGEAAMPVDTHVFRVSHRLGFAAPKDDTPEKVEKALVSLIPARYLSLAHHWLLFHGRYVCVARKPKCTECPFDSICPKKKADNLR